MSTSTSLARHARSTCPTLSFGSGRPSRTLGCCSAGMPRRSARASPPVRGRRVPRFPAPAPSLPPCSLLAPCLLCCCRSSFPLPSRTLAPSLRAHARAAAAPDLPHGPPPPQRERSSACARTAVCANSGAGSSGTWRRVRGTATLMPILLLNSLIFLSQGQISYLSLCCRSQVQNVTKVTLSVQQRRSNCSIKSGVWRM